LKIRSIVFEDNDAIIFMSYLGDHRVLRKGRRGSPSKLRFIQLTV